MGMCNRALELEHVIICIEKPVILQRLQILYDQKQANKFCLTHKSRGKESKT